MRWAPFWDMPLRWPLLWPQHSSQLPFFTRVAKRMLLSDRTTLFLASSSKLTSNVAPDSLPPCRTRREMVKPSWGAVLAG